MLFIINTYYVIRIFCYYTLCDPNLLLLRIMPSVIIMGNNDVIMSNNECIITHYYPL